MIIRSTCSAILVAWSFLQPLTAGAVLVPAGTEFQVNTYTTSAQYVPSVAADADGNFVVVWYSNANQDGGGYGVFGQRFSSNGTFIGTEFQINTYTPATQFLPFTEATPDGRFVVVWTSVGQDGDVAGVFGQRFASTGAPAGTEFQVNTYTDDVQGFSKVAVAADGDFVVVWNGNVQDGDQSGIFAQRFASTGAFLGTEFQVNTYTPSFQSDPAAAVLTSGGFVVVWRSDLQDGDSAGIFAQRFGSTGDPLGTEFQVNVFTSNLQSEPEVAALDNTDFVVVWRSEYQDDSRSAVVARRFSSGGTGLGDEFLVNSFTSSFQHSPDVAGGPRTFVITWASDDQDGSFGGVFARLFANGGTRIGPEFQVNTFTTFYQDNPSIAGSPSGQFIIAWQSDLQDGDRDGVFGQRFEPLLLETPAPVLSPSAMLASVALLALVGSLALRRKPRQ